MKSHIHLPKLRETIVITLLGVLMYVSQVIMASLPNIELVSFLIIIVARKFGFKSLFSVYIFVFLEVLTYGFAQWVISYLYVWAILAVLVCLFRKIESPIFYSVLSSGFGFLFGVLCSPVSFFVGGFGYGISWIISGLWFDFLHGCGNFLLTFLLYKPITKVLNKAI
ncbi:MAG: hypothetical protein E7537_03380 [Ruminococcaceae bacterium]|nr:hypothetical protein [Oscillospiraceae bacterium]